LPFSPSRRRNTARLAVTAAACAGAALAVPTAAPGAGTSSASGGAAYVGKPEIKQVRCASGCSRNAVRNGGAIRLRGRKLSYASKVVFLGGAGRGDDVAVPVDPSSDRSLKVEVPYSATSGPVAAWASSRVRSRPTRPLRIVPPPPPEPKGELSPAPGPSDPGAPRVETAVNRGTFFFGGPGGIVFTYRLDAPAAVEVALVRLTDNVAVASWSAPAVAPGEVQTIRWDGRSDGVAQPDARYGFRLVAKGADGATSHSVADGEAERDAFELRGHIFPVRATHDYGGAGAQFGAGRSGHSHQGHDVFARCGSRLVAARGGVVKANKSHAAAGNYVVIDADDTDVDYFYAHLVSPSPFKQGQRVATGQQIGQVGQSGNARGCHLHFEMWSGPGWYTGGAPFNPLQHLKAWDAFS
jgi:murein DD-endopeptidase MepM/ murein hydrolase activator NlpD